MLNARDVLGTLLGSGMGGRNPRLGGMGMPGGGGLGGLGGMLGGGGGLGGLGGLGGMPGGGGLGGLGGMLGGGGGGLGGMLGGGGMSRGGMGGGIQGALIGMLGGMAMSALQRRMQEAASRPAEEPDPIDDSPSLPRPPSAPVTRDSVQAGAGATAGEVPELDEDRATFLVRVMVAAAAADMQIDQTEQNRILGKLEEAGTEQAGIEFIKREMRSPMSIEDIAREAAGPDTAVQAYAAALAAIDVDKAMERRFLDNLARRLGLDGEIVGEIHDQLGQPRPTPLA